ncbi:T-protein [Defluviimonas aquaemixtae]|uniref:chorismate mutase n=1 Tax=Albidovulum aquaemixtae TaxID=1542388 RepID=A0A2R8BN37_9RHOB|nr:chorismate mutase [Defluviimonas aquaemixtae]SPH24858.1 T-protein [Defluviimonas aquaemixtae]
MKAADCATMTDVRAEIDRIDRALVALLAERSGYIDRAAELKPALGLPARIDARVEEVFTKIRAAARLEGLDPALAEMLWRRIIDWSIAREETTIGDR